MTRAPEPTMRQLLGYALPALPVAALSLPFYVMIPEFYTADVGVPIATVGFVLLLVRILDALTDPLAGALADWTRPKFGRRRSWVLVSAPLVALAAWFIMRPPSGAGAGYLLLWATALSLAWTAISVPYQAWGAELSRSYEGRTRVAAFRESFTVTGTLIALLLPAVVQMQGGSSRDGLAALALFIVVLLPIGALVAVFVAPEPVERVRAATDHRAGFAHLAANRPFRRLLIAFFVNSLANGLPAALFLFFVADRLGARDSAGPLLVLYFLCGVAGVPLWLWLARKTSKHRAWALGMGLACVAFALAPFLGPGQLILFAGVCVVTGFALGADVVLPAAVQADVIDVDTANSGQERAGLYLGLWALATKLAFAGAVGIAFPLLALSGYDPGNNLRAPEGLVMLGVLYAALPVVLKLMAIALIWNFPLGKEEMAAVALRISKRT
jgi:glycoside/pentoside/hexuronide:cation symporter, GPH family